jgi:hypothetical protein
MLHENACPHVVKRVQDQIHYHVMGGAHIACIKVWAHHHVIIISLGL